MIIIHTAIAKMNINLYLLVCAARIELHQTFFFKFNWIISSFSFSSYLCRVLKPPGGGSSDLFGGSVPSTPRSIRNNMASNIFATPSDVKNGNGKSHTSPCHTCPINASLDLFFILFRFFLRFFNNNNNNNEIKNKSET